MTRKKIIRNKVIINPMKKEDIKALKQVQELLKYMNIKNIEKIYSLIESKEKDKELKININTENVVKTDFKMETLLGQIINIPSKEIENLDRNVIKINNVTIEEEGVSKTPIFSKYFYQSLGTSRATNLEGIWLPCGDVPIKEALQGIRYSKLEDEILGQLNLFLETINTKTQEQYQSTFSKFTGEFSTWQELMDSILKYGRFISETNAMISYKLYLLNKKDKSVSKVRATGIKVTKKSKQKQRKGRAKPTPKRRKGRGIQILKRKPKMKTKKKR